MHFKQLSYQGYYIIILTYIYGEIQGVCCSLLMNVKICMISLSMFKPSGMRLIHSYPSNVGLIDNMVSQLDSRRHNTISAIYPRPQPMCWVERFKEIKLTGLRDIYICELKMLLPYSFIGLFSCTGLNSRWISPNYHMQLISCNYRGEERKG